MRSCVLARLRAHWRGPLLTLASTALLAALATACQGSADESEDRLAVTPPAGDVTPILASHELTLGQNRFVLGLQDRDNNLILDAHIHLRFFRLKDGEAPLEVGAETLPITIQPSFLHEHEDGTSDVHTGAEVGGYVAYVDFNEAGLWGAEVTATVDGDERTLTSVQFEVLEDGSTPAVGELAPRSEQRTLRDVDDISEIDSSIPSRPEMHELTIAEAIDSGRPTVVAFATPAFCRTRLCGPFLDSLVDPLFERYGDRVTFIHVEPYVAERARQGELVPAPAMVEWGLPSDTWLFVIDQEGRVADKFEAIATVEEVEPVLRRLLGESAG